MTDPGLFKSLKFLIKYFVPLALIVTLFGSCYWKFYVEPKVDDKIRPLIVGIFEIQTTLNKIVPEKIRREVRKDVSDFEKLLQKK